MVGVVLLDSLNDGFGLGVELDIGGVPGLAFFEGQAVVLNVVKADRQQIGDT